MRCNDIMRRPVTCARRGETVQSAAIKMRDAHIGFLPVCDEHDRLLGVVTDRDMAVRLCATGESPQKTPIEAIMSTDVVSCSPAVDVTEVERLMASKRKSRLVVVADDGTPVGVISLSDLAVMPGVEAADLLGLIAGREVLTRYGVKHRPEGAG